MKAAESTRQSAFSRIELVVIVATLGLLAATLLPAMARTRVRPQGSQCVNNLRQLIMAWQMYVNESGRPLPSNPAVFPANPDYNNSPYPNFKARWVGGDMRGGSVGSPYNCMDVSNTALLLDPNYSELGPYLKSPALFKCPSDHSTWDGLPRVRSYSMNNAIGSAYNGTYQDAGHNPVGHWLPGTPSGGMWRVFLKEGDIQGTAPSSLFVLLDEHPNTINDATFVFQMPTSPLQTRWIDCPAPYHNNSSNLAFADGHVETHRWLNPQVFPAIVWAAETGSNLGGAPYPSTPNNPDVMWLARRSTAPAPGRSWPAFLQ